MPTELPERQPDSVPGRRADEQPVSGPLGPRTPYPVDDPTIPDPKGPGSEPDLNPGIAPLPVGTM